MFHLARNPFHALRHRNFRYFFLGQFISLSGTWMQVVGVGWLVLQLTDSPFWVGLVSALGSLPILLFTLWGGVVADRVDRRRALLILQGFMLADALALGFLTWSGHVTVGWVMLLALVHGTSAAFEVPIRQAFILEMVGREDLMNAIALNSSNFNLTRIAGPVVAGSTIAVLGIAACFFLNAVSFLAVIASLLLMRLPPPAPSQVRGSALAVMREGIRYALGEREPRRLLLFTAMLSIFGFSFVAMLPVLARDALGGGAQSYGGLMAAVGVGAGAGALGMAAFGHRFPRLGVVRVAGLGFAVALALTASAGSWLVAAGALALAGISMILSNVAINTQLQTAAPDRLRGRLMGFYSLMVLGVAPFGSLQAGFVAEHFGVAASIGLGSLATLMAVYLCLPPAGKGEEPADRDLAPGGLPSSPATPG